MQLSGAIINHKGRLLLTPTLLRLCCVKL